MIWFISFIFGLLISWLILSFSAQLSLAISLSCIAWLFFHNHENCIRRKERFYNSLLWFLKELTKERSF